VAVGVLAVVGVLHLATHRSDEHEAKQCSTHEWLQLAEVHQNVPVQPTYADSDVIDATGADARFDRNNK
jgi:hypothetical protein